MSAELFTGYDILQYGEQDKDALGKTSIQFSFGSSGSRQHEEIDPRGKLKVEMQYAMSSCTGHGLTSAAEMLWALQSGGWESVEQLSRYYAYKNGQAFWQGPGYNRDNGCTIEAVVRAATEVGVPLESLCRYPDRYGAPLPDLKSEAAKHRIGSHCESTDWDQSIDFQDGLGSEIFGTIWTGAMHNFRGLVLDLQHVKEDGSRSGHCYCSPGFVLYNGVLHKLIVNSHSEAWGTGGWALMTRQAYDYLIGRPYSVIMLLSDLTGVERVKRKLATFGMG